MDVKYSPAGEGGSRDPADRRSARTWSSVFRTATPWQRRLLPAVPNLIAWASFVSSVQQRTEISRIPIG